MATTPLRSQIPAGPLIDLHGRAVSRLLGVRSPDEDGHDYFFLETDCGWIRFFLDVGVYFASWSTGPEAGEDPTPEQLFADPDAHIVSATLADARLTIDLSNTTRVTIREDLETSSTYATVTPGHQR